ncbi:carbohydrate ABC transporter permease [Arthrobacter sp. NPDC057009]|uniref:carbohydrate ABC transporter permease n=1 Tax=Arthrobacter sp. NPDC057009 TaxID=3345996 RepID=UPI003640F13C
MIALAVHFLAVGAGAIYAFTDWNGTDTPTWIGLDNFKEIFQSTEALGSVINTILLSFVAVVLSNIFGMALAMGLHRTIRSRNWLRGIFFAPVVLSPLAVSYIWQFIFDAQGPLNKLLEAVGLESWARPWLADPTWSKWTILVVLVWQYSGLAMAFYLAGLQSIPAEVEEAASVDGASTLRRLRSITLPLLAPAVTASVTITTVFSLRVFDQVLALTGGGPAQASETLATQIYAQTFVAGRFGYGAALALVLTALVAFVSIMQLVVLRAQEKRI